MGLVGESGAERNLDQRLAASEAVACEVEPSHQRVAVRAGAEGGPELARELVAAQPRGRLELLRPNHSRSPAKERPSARESGIVEPPGRADGPRPGGRGQQAFGDSKDYILERELL